MRPLTICAIGAHPDDGEVHMGGSAVQWADNGAEIHFVSITNGQAGHHTMSTDALIKRRVKEAQKAASVLGVRYHFMKAIDGHLEPTLEHRLNLIRLLRGIRPDVIITNRPSDYHPDHRYTSQLVMDTAYSLMVPKIAEDIPPLDYNPVFLFWYDGFVYPELFVPDFFVDISTVIERKLEALHCHESQFYEWLPWVEKKLDEVPDSMNEKKDWLRRDYITRFDCPKKETYEKELVRQYGQEKAVSIIHFEAFAVCRYGAALSDEIFSQLAL